MREIAIRIGGMTCGGCARRIERKLSAMASILRVAVDQPAGVARLTVADDFRQSAVAEAIVELGFTVEATP